MFSKCFSGFSTVLHALTCAYMRLHTQFCEFLKLLKIISRIDILNGKHTGFKFTTFEQKSIQSAGECRLVMNINR